jgi:PGF-CTERM protein
MAPDTTAGIRSAGTSRKWGIVLGVSLLVGLFAFAVGGGVATALQDGDAGSAPNVSAAYYGEVYINGEPAPVGTTVTANIDGEQRGSITVDEPGKYGSAAGYADKLVVTGTATETGKAVTFLVNGEEVATDRAVTFDVRGGEVNLGSRPAPAPESDSDPKSREPVLEIVDGTLRSEGVRIGERINVTATVENVGATGTGTVALFVDGDRETNRTVTLEPGATEDVTFDLTFARTGTHDIAVGERAVGTVTVDGRAPAEFAVENAGLSATEIGVGESVGVTATVENAGPESRTQTVELVVQGSVAAETEVTLDANETKTVSFTESFERPDEYDIAVGDAEAGTITVTGGEPIPGFGVAAAIAAVLGTVVALRRR